MFTLGYPFHPWKEGKAIADGGSILSYIRETATKFGIDPLIRYRHRIVSASWSSDRGRWSVVVEVGQAKERKTFQCRFLYPAPPATTATTRRTCRRSRKRATGASSSTRSGGPRISITPASASW